MKVYSFEKLECWQNAKNLSVWIYGTTQYFPADEKFGLVSQMRRAAISIASNVAEKTSRVSLKDQSHFSTMAYSSAIELLNDLIVSNDLYEQGRAKIEKQMYLIAGLRKSQQIRKHKAALPKPF